MIGLCTLGAGLIGWALYYIACSCANQQEVKR